METRASETPRVPHPHSETFTHDHLEGLERDPSLTLSLSSLAGPAMNQNNVVLCDAGCIGHGFLHSPCSLSLTKCSQSARRMLRAWQTFSSLGPPTAACILWALPSCGPGEWWTAAAG